MMGSVGLYIDVCYTDADAKLLCSVPAAKEAAFKIDNLNHESRIGIRFNYYSGEDL